MPTYIKPVAGLAITKAKAATLPAPTLATDGVSLASWAPFNGMGYPDGYLTMFADGNATVTVGQLWGLDPISGLWGFIAPLNNGAAITLSTTQAFFQSFTMPTVFSSLAVVGTIAGGNNVGYTVAPVAEVV